ncbi:MAG TPA: protein kinase, partial [Acidobacteriota bacterium]|nr:protein kinase [Acidobacteriota bacterium]
MKAERWPRIQEIFEAALAVPARSLKAWLEDTCGSDSELRGEVEAMLQAHQRQGVLDLPLDTLISDLFSPESQGPDLGHLENRFRIFRELGRGGMGVVYHAHDELLDRDIALKFLPAHLQTDADARKRLLAEARAVSALDHKSICTVHDVGETEDGSIYIVMAFYGGKTLSEILNLRTLPIEECLRIALRLSEGLQCAHDAGVIHRDVKPSNIIVCDNGEVKLLDFGIAKLQSRNPQTEPGARVGTISYMSPEQARGEETDHRTDIWSLGVVLYEMLTGKHPFHRENPAAILNAILHESPPPASIYRDGVAPVLDHILSRTVEKSRQDRYPTMQELGSDLSKTLQSGSTTSIIQHRISARRIPSPLTPFIGRERELRNLKELLSRARLVTLTGPAGTGKTRLSLKVAQGVERLFEGGAYFVPLAPIHDPDLVVTTIAQNLGIGDISGEAPLTRLKRSLAGSRKFIVLDNFEQVVAAAPIIADLLEHCPELKIMVTSRIAL